MTWDHIVYGSCGAAAVAVAGTAAGLAVSWRRRTRRPAPSPPPTVVVVQPAPLEPVTQILPVVLERDLPGREPPWRWVNATDPAVTRILPAQRDRSRT